MESNIIKVLNQSSFTDTQVTLRVGMRAEVEISTHHLVAFIKPCIKPRFTQCDTANTSQ